MNQTTCTTLRRHRCIATALTLGGALASTTPLAQGPSAPPKNVRLVVNIPAGGIVDAVARIIAQKLADAWGVTVLVDNRPGASGNIGAEHVARAQADGGTYLVTLDNVATVNTSLYRKMPFDPVKELAPVTMLVVSPLAMVVNPSLPVRNVRDLVQLARARPGDVKFASAGSGTPQHFAGLLLSSLAKVRIEHIPYKGSIAAITDVASGQVELMMPSFTVTMPLLQASKVKALAVTSASRLAQFPQLPTVAESGVPGYEVNFWVGMFAPARTTLDAARATQQAVAKILALPEVRERLQKDVMLPVGNTPEELARTIAADAAKWGALVREFKLQAD